jgi:hypothetical protein
MGKMGIWSDWREMEEYASGLFILIFIQVFQLFYSSALNQYFIFKLIPLYQLF